METIEVLRQAADVIRERGWAQKVNEDEVTGAVCLDGAIHIVITGGQALHEDESCLDALDPLANTLHLSHPLDAVKWQDDLHRTQDEVLELIETTIARLGGT